MFAKQNQPHFQAALQCFHPASLQTVQATKKIPGTFLWELSMQLTHKKKTTTADFFAFFDCNDIFFFFQACNILEMCNEDFMRGN